MGTDDSTRVGGWLVVIGAVGVAVITGIYASAPPAASAPFPTTSPVAEALAATLSASGKLWLAGTMGMVADIILIAGCGLLALRHDEPIARRLCWLLIALSTLLFVGVDALAGQVIPALAVATGDDTGAFLLARKMFDACFVLGVGTFAAASIAAALEPSFSRLLRWFATGVAAISLVAFTLHLVGVTLPLLIGASVGLAAILGVLLGYRELRAA